MAYESPFIYLDPVIPPIFAGRKKELDLTRKALFEMRESIILYGNDAIGKSSLISTIYKTINEYSTRSVLAVRINAFDFIKAVETNFLALVTHQICATIWTKLMHRQYSELIEDTLINVRGDIVISSEEKTLKRIFRIVSNEKISGYGKVNKEIGGNFILQGKMKHEGQIVSERMELHPFEFLHLLDELNDIIKSFGHDSIIVFCDELNHLPIQVNTDILRNYFSIFSSNKIQFVIIVVNPELSRKSDAQKLIESFNFSIELKTFQSNDEVGQLLSNSLKAANSQIIFGKDAANFLYSLTDGHPWFIQKICAKAYLKACHNDSSIILVEDLSRAFSEFSSELEIYRDMVSKGLPFRKFNLSK